MNNQENETRPEENPAFYDIFFNKEGGVARYMPYLRDFARRRNLDLSCTLQYKDSATSSRGLPKLFILTGQDGIFKARICVSPKEAGRIWNNTRYALERAIPTSVPIELEGPIVLLKYIEGEPLMDLDEIKLRDIATIHSNINRFVQLNYSGDLAKKIRGLARVSFQFLGESGEAGNQYAIFEENFPQKFFPVFDHQDFGFNNLIKNREDLFLIDEEAFGVLPFGYSLHRALNGRAFYSVCGNEVERRAYLSFFSREQREYYEKTKTFWGALYRLREGARLLVGGNKELSKRVLENGR